MKNERTSKIVATNAARVLDCLQGATFTKSARIYVENVNGDLFLLGTAEGYISVGDIQGIAASCLTQAPDKPKKKK